MKCPCVYIVTSQKNGTLYIGVTSDLPQRVHEHRTETKGFASEHKCHRLVWFEDHDTMNTAIQREKSLKRWRRQWKIELIEKSNPNWQNLHPETGEYIPSYYPDTKQD